MARKGSSPMVEDRERLRALYQTRQPEYEEALGELYRQVRDLLEEQGHAPTVKYRVKRFPAYLEKLRKVRRGEKGGEAGLITDLLGLRIICPFLEDLDTVERLLAEHFEIVESQRKASQNSFREFGYDSVHMLIRLDAAPEPLPHTAAVCEIQLRTILQDAWAEVEHELVYKSDIALPNESIKRKLASLNATLTLSDLIFQEIRDYQKELRHRGRKRRQSIEVPPLVQDSIALSAPPEEAAGGSVAVGAPPGPLASDLEKTMLAALDAHSHNDLQAAIRLYGELLEMELEAPVRAMVYNHRGMAHFALGHLQQAHDDFTRATQHDEQSFRSWVNRGLVHRMLREFSHSVRDYSRALEIEPASGEGFFGRAQTYYEMQLFSLASADCERALALEPAFEAAEGLMRLIRRGPFQA